MSGGPLRVELDADEILADLFWPTPPPGRWLDPDTAHIDLLLAAVERAEAGGRPAP